MLSIILQAGGQSKRMARDKALVPFRGIPLIQHLAKRFSPLGVEILVISNQPDSIRFLDLPIHPDVIPDRGALGGLYTALSIANTPLIGLIAIDLPFASPALIEYLSREVMEKALDACLPGTPKRLEPMHAVYRVDTCKPLVKKAIDQELWRMVSWHENANINLIPPAKAISISECEYTFLNINTPEDLKKAEEISLQQEQKDC